MGAEATSVEEISPEMEEQVEALLEAARYDDLDDLKGLESAGVSLDAKDSQRRTALHMAAANGHHGIIEYLISKGVDLNSLNQEKNTPLHWACLNGHVEVVRTLILAGADVSICNCHDRTPLDEASSQNNTDMFNAINEAIAQVELTRATVS
ncbi:uncharacterized protein LOC130796840 [Amaranthus tricolor]|uniref:uncharacterized protein LOC130796840 n=1 Tax=Amaranthus tricolor TaxID=29722 RepID=UPI00258716E1|nr:uncharacterized protein LOC130796840 [Amaranthus tricolor]